MSAPSDGARADARKRLAANVPPIDDMRRLPDLLHILFPCGDTSDLDAPPCWTAAQTVLASDWLAGVIAAAKAEALRDAALALGMGPSMRVLVERESCDWWTDRPVASWLNDRARRIEESGR